MTLILRPEAEEELIEAIDWYEARAPGLGADLFRCVEASLGRISRHPEAYPLVHRGTRMATVRRFPYLVLYRVQQKEIVVVAVFHAKRDPKSWKRG
jgi:plasmid stabilization system protein ParE